MKLTQIIQFLTFVSALLPQSTITELQRSNVGAQDAAIYVRKQITAGNVVKLIDGTTEQIIGLTNVDGNKLDDYRNFIIEKLSFKYATDATATDPSAVNYLAADVPAVLRNSELVLRQEGRTPINIPIMAILAGKDASPGSIDGDKFNLMVWSLVREGQKFELNIEMPNGASLGSDNHFVEVGLFGAQTSLKATA